MSLAATGANHLSNAVRNNHELAADMEPRGHGYPIRCGDTHPDLQTTFTCFSRQPSEIRCVIWRLAQTRRVIQLVPGSPYPLLAVTGCSKSVNAVNSESLKEAMKSHPTMMRARPWDWSRYYMAKVGDIIYLDHSVLEGHGTLGHQLSTADYLTNSYFWHQVLSATRRPHAIKHLMIHQDFLLDDHFTRDSAFSRLAELYVIIDEGKSLTQARFLEPHTTISSGHLSWSGCTLEARRTSAGRLNNVLTRLEARRVATGQLESVKLFAMVSGNVLTEGLWVCLA